MSPYPIMARKSIGTASPTAPGARIVPPAIRRTWTHTRGTSAISRGSLARRGTRYHHAASAYATSENVNWIANRTKGFMVPTPITRRRPQTHRSVREFRCFPTTRVPPTGHAGSLAEEPCVRPGSRSRTSSSARRLLHQRADPGLVGGGQLRQSVGGRPHVAVVEVRRVVEPQRGVPGLELLRGLKEA